MASYILTSAQAGVGTGQLSDARFLERQSIRAYGQQGLVTTIISTRKQKAGMEQLGTDNTLQSTVDFYICCLVLMHVL